VIQPSGCGKLSSEFSLKAAAGRVQSSAFRLREVEFSLQAAPGRVQSSEFSLQAAPGFDVAVVQWTMTQPIIPDIMQPASGARMEEVRKCEI
jgi:hypothetical protein